LKVDKSHYSKYIQGYKNKVAFAETIRPTQFIIDYSSNDS